jgi:hypothetical protein
MICSIRAKIKFIPWLLEAADATGRGDWQGLQPGEKQMQRCSSSTTKLLLSGAKQKRSLLCGGEFLPTRKTSYELHVMFILFTHLILGDHDGSIMK